MVCGSPQLCGMLGGMLTQYCLYICRGEGPLSPSAPRLLNQSVLTPLPIEPCLCLCKLLLHEPEDPLASQIL